jgi:hypothetical protein
MIICTKCRELKSESEFAIRKETKKGFTSKCKACQREYYKQYYKERAKEITAKTTLYRKTHEGWRKKMDLKYAKTEKGKIRRLKAHMKWRKKNPLKYRAHMRVAKAIQRGKIIKGECAYPNGNCEGRIEGHHTDYSKPLDITWFCKKHHMLADKVYKLTQIKCH